MLLGVATTVDLLSESQWQRSWEQHRTPPRRRHGCGQRCEERTTRGRNMRHHGIMNDPRNHISPGAFFRWTHRFLPGMDSSSMFGVGSSRLVSSVGVRTEPQRFGTSTPAGSVRAEPPGPTRWPKRVQTSPRCRRGSFCLGAEEPKSGPIAPVRIDALWS